jgi:SAM-dependent methyltransferase
MSDTRAVPGSATFSAELFEPLFAAEDRHFWFRSRNRCIAAAARSLPNFRNVKNVMEHGCGTGFVLAELQRVFPGAEVTGADLFAEGLAFARRRFAGPLLQTDVLAGGFKEAFDLAGFFDVLEHLDDDLRVLRALREQLRPGGALLLTVPAHMALWSDYDVTACHRRRYSRRELTARLAEAGFRVDYCTEFMSVLFPLMWVRRRLTRGSASAAPESGREATARELADLKIHPLPNRMLELVLRPEAWLISRRVRLPIGTSLLAVATRPA